jgi:DNA-binding CsgD family transcriptional regulator
VLRGRTSECARLDRLLEEAHGGRSETLVLRGEPGIGKSALLDYVADQGAGYRIVRAVGVESEMELPYATLHQLCLPLLDGLDRLPDPQRDALHTAFGLSSGPQPDRFLVGLAALSLMSDAVVTQPLVGLIDDAQWLDRSSAQALSFVARRLHMESVVMVFARRDGRDPNDDLAGLPELRLRGLSDDDARGLLASAGFGPLDERVRNRIIDETRGNPLALVELARGSSPAGLEGGYAVPKELPARIEATFRKQAEELPPDTQRLLLVAAAEPLGDPVLLWGAAAELGISADAAAAAEAKDLIEIRARVVFRHPLLRSAIYRGASTEERRAAHGALGAATDEKVDPDRRAWHRAQAALMPDEEVAAELEASASRAQARGGLAAAGAFLERASELTPDPTRAAQRALSAARAMRLAGLHDAAQAMLAVADQGSLDELDRAMAMRLRGQIALDLSRGGDAAPLLLEAAVSLEPLDVGLARETHLESLWAASNAGRFGDGVATAAAAAKSAPPPSGSARASDLLVEGLAASFEEGYAEGVPILKRALATFREELGPGAQDPRWPWMATRVAAELLDDEAWSLFATWHAQMARDTGALSLLPVTLGYLAALRIQEGSLESAAALLDESDAITGESANITRLLLLAWRGDETKALRVAGTMEPQAIARRDGLALTAIAYARAVLHNGLAGYESALSAAQQSIAQDELSVSNWSLPELIEAAVRCDRLQVAEAALERLMPRTRAAGTDFALGVEARARALVDGDAAEENYNGSIELLGGTRMRLPLARAHLLYGEWLRRESRRVDAREQLRTAHDLLRGMGAEGFAERARRELAATGEKARKRSVETRDDLTPQEVQIAQLANTGLTNSEIAAELFLSPRTIEWHLRKVYGKLGIGSRKELREALPGARRTVVVT